MKTFGDLGIKDKLFYCSPNSYQYKSDHPSSLSTSGIRTGLGDDFWISKDDFKKSRILISSSWTSIVIFSNESEAIRYCKAQLIKELHIRIDKANKAIESVKSLRKHYWEELNYKWSEDQIRKLENELK